MTVLVRNVSGVHREYSFGETLLAGETDDYTYLPMVVLARSLDLSADILSGNVIVSDGVEEFTPQDALSFLRGEIVRATSVKSENITATDSNVKVILETNKVTGSVKIQGLTLPVVDGEADQVLVTDGSGNLTFKNVPASPSSSPYEFIGYAACEEVSITNSTSLIPKTVFSKNNFAAGTYKITWYYEWSYNSTAYNFVGEVWLDGTCCISKVVSEPKESAGFNSPTGQNFSEGGFYVSNLTAGPHNIIIWWRSTKKNVNSLISKARILVERIG